jgi:HAD superfamily hydrolase (TIGR01509 family)
MHINNSDIKALVFDFSRVLLFAKGSNYSGSLNSLHRTLLEKDADYPFLDYFYLNQDLLDCLKTIAGKRLIIFTSGSVQDAPAIQPAVRRVFETVYSAEKMGVRKAEPQSYVRLCNEMNLVPTEVLLIDDTQRNLDAAAQAGLQTVLFTGNRQLFPFLDKLR